MSEHKVKLHWETNGSEFTGEPYSRNHRLSFDNGSTVIASAAPAYFGDSAAIDPEEMLVAAISSCHMLTFLAVASKRNYIVVDYKDNATGILEKNSAGKIAITRIELAPEINFSGEKQPTREELEQLHHRAHANCFIANSVQCEVKVKF